jgi:SAM-dependent methyltransferase
VIETAYDSVPYPGHVHTHSHPSRVAAIARLFGIDAPAVATARVLEIGCGDGGNLIAIAYTLPRAHCVGFDLAPTAIARGQQRIEALGLKNCELMVADLATVGPSLGDFDYVIAHGAYSWVQPPLREALLRLVSDVLSPNGVAFVSYNVFPGWRIAGMVREMLRYHTLGIDDPGERVEQAKALLKFVAVAHDDDDPYGRLLAAECERVSGFPPWYLHHDDLADVNDPVYFHEFVAQAKRFGLAFLAEADFASMTGADLPEAAREKLDELSGDSVLRGQYLDFVKCRRFRQSLLTRAAQSAAPGPVRERVRDLLVASAATPDIQTVNLAAGIEVQFRWGQRASLKTDHPLAKTVFLALRERWPEAMSFDNLLSAVARLGYGNVQADDAVALEGILLAAFGLRMVELTAEPWSAVAQPSQHPRASAIARSEAATSDVLTSLLHRRIQLDGPLALSLLRLCDGTRDRQALTEELARLDSATKPESLGILLGALTRLGVVEA